jgi:rRNA maturation endonuclease Nob1
LTFIASGIYLSRVKSEVFFVDTGYWTLRCQNCKKTFTVELTATQQITDSAKNHACPSCQSKPGDLPDSPSGTRHRIIGFSAVKEKRPR